MSGRRMRQSNRIGTSTSRITDDQITDLISQLNRALPEMRTNNRRSKKAQADKVLGDACNYIKELQKEVDDLSERLSQLLPTVDAESLAAMVRRLV